MMQIVVVTDYVCPWCYVAEKLLEDAIARTGLKVQVSVQPYELSPEGTPAVDTYNDVTRRAHYQPLIGSCEKMGMNVHIPPKVIPRPRTRLAFEGRYLAERLGCMLAWDKAVFKAYFEDEKDIGDINVLMECAAEAGMDPDELKSVLLSGTYTDEEQQAVAYARQWLNITSVPTMFIDGRQVQLIDYTPEEMLQILWGASVTGIGGSCDSNGCEV